MSVITLTFIDWLIIVLYFVFIIGIGLYLKRYTKTGDDYFMAGRKNSSWVAGLAFLSANLGALEILGWTGGTMKYGMFVSHFYWIGAIPAMLFLGLYMMPFYYSSRIHSVPGYLKLRFDERSRLLNAFSFAIMTVLMSGINLYLMALVLKTILGWDWHVSMWVSAAAVGCYIMLGGLMSAIFTEIVQFFLIWFGLFLVAILGAVEMGGLDKVFSGLPDALSHLWQTSGDASQNAMGVTWIGIVMGLGFVLSFGYWTTDFLVVQRAFSSKDLRSARMTPITASFFKMALPFIIVVAGLVAWRLAQMPGSGFSLLPHPDTGEPWNDTALPLLIARYFPAGLVGLGITALLAGFMAGQAGNVSAFNTVWTYDIYRVLFKKDASDAHLVWVGRLTTIVGILISVGTAYLAMQFNTIMDYIQAIFSWVNAPLFATMLLGMFWKRTTSAGAFWGLVAGMITSFSLFLGFKFDMMEGVLSFLFRAYFLILLCVMVKEITKDKLKTATVGLVAAMWVAFSVSINLGAKAVYYVTFSHNPSDMTKNMWQAAWAWLICFAMTIAISFFTKPKADAELVGLVKGLTEKTAGEERVAWFRRPAFWAAVSLVAVISLNIYFW